ncbi:transcription factor bHLH30-like isoform X2 [Andrographis paniculata]|nr:transcription factor bHLH30-like isoform X2 [Andrographis paniculata]
MGNGSEMVMSPVEAKAMAASNNHKEAERRRRKRINGHIATLKSILPNTIKTDKASLLGETVRRVKELRKTTAQLQHGAAADATTTTASSASLLRLMFPSETDELILCQCEEDSQVVQATLSCEDRPETILDLTQAVKSADGKVVRAEMSTVGGRTKMVLWVKLMGEAAAADSGILRRALRKAMDKQQTGSGLGPGPGLLGSKRGRYHHGKGQEDGWW